MFSFGIPKDHICVLVQTVLDIGATCEQEKWGII